MAGPSHKSTATVNWYEKPGILAAIVGGVFAIIAAIIVPIIELIQPSGEDTTLELAEAIVRLQNEEDEKKDRAEIFNLIKKYAEEICGNPEDVRDGFHIKEEIISDSPEVAEVLSELGVSAEASITTERWSGVAPEDVGTELIAIRDCQIEVFKNLTEKFLLNQ